MKAEDIIAALDLPDGASVSQRVPKRLLTENGAPTAADKRRINEGIEEVVWLAALKPTTIGVPEYRDSTREYLEISVLRMALDARAKSTRLVELVHRAIPYPVLLITVQAEVTSISGAHKRWSEGETGKTVLDGEVFITRTDLPTRRDGAGGDVFRAFREALAVSRQPRSSLLALYEGWIGVLVAYNAVRFTGKLVLPSSMAESLEQRAALCEYTRLENYLNRDEISELNRIVTMWLDFAEDQARRRKQVFLKDWETKLNDFLRFNDRAVLDGKGRVSKANADIRAEAEYEEFAARRRALAEAEGERAQQRVLEEAAKNLPKSQKEGRRKP